MDVCILSTLLHFFHARMWLVAECKWWDVLFFCFSFCISKPFIYIVSHISCVPCKQKHFQLCSLCFEPQAWLANLVDDRVGPKLYDSVMHMQTVNIAIKNGLVC